jgi:RNA polymerase sigma factor (sigma-70 family)
MATAPSNILNGRQGTARAETCIADLGDEELLALYLEGGAGVSEEAFRSLMARHGPMIMGVCRHVLHQDQDAEDAFQAAFLTLARKADTIRNRKVLAGWLYEVAYRIAVRARANAARRRDQERQGAAMSATVTNSEQENDAAWNELRPVLHDEVNRLPEKYRLPVILSYLEGKSNEEVARLLDWPVGTVKGRLSRARDLLRSRLTRRGLALSAAFLCAALSRGEVFAETVPRSLIDRTLSTAMRVRRNRAAVTPGTDLPTDSLVPHQVETYSRYAAITGGRIAGRGSALGVMVLITFLSVGFAVRSFLASNPFVFSSLRNAIWYLSHGQWSQLCH